jgi:hypothetical protein
MTGSTPSPDDSRNLTKRLFAEKERWHRRQARMSFARKLLVLDNLFESAKDLPRPASSQHAPKGDR